MFNKLLLGSFLLISTAYYSNEASSSNLSLSPSTIYFQNETGFKNKNLWVQVPGEPLVKHLPRELKTNAIRFLVHLKKQPKEKKEPATQVARSYQSSNSIATSSESPKNIPLIFDGKWTQIENGATYKVTISSEATDHVLILIESSIIQPKYWIKIDKLQR